MWTNVSALMIATIMSAAPAFAFNASGADLLGVRLDMSEAEVGAQLSRQGFSMTKNTSACSDKGACVVTLKAVTKDGELRIILPNETNATRIEYTLLAEGVGEPEKIKAAMIARFGIPDQQKPMVWCRAVAVNGLCPVNQASLAYRPETRTMILQSAEPAPR